MKLLQVRAETMHEDDKIVSGEVFIFFAYANAKELTLDEQIFRPGDFGVVAKLRDDGAMLSFRSNEYGKIIDFEGDTLFPDEVVRLSYMRPQDVSSQLSGLHIDTK